MPQLRPNDGSCARRLSAGLSVPQKVSDLVNNWLENRTYGVVVVGVAVHPLWLYQPFQRRYNFVLDAESGVREV